MQGWMCVEFMQAVLQMLFVLTALLCVKKNSE